MRVLNTYLVVVVLISIFTERDEENKYFWQRAVGLLVSATLTAMFWIAQPSERKESDTARDWGALYLAGAQAVGILCWLFMINKDTVYEYVPYERAITLAFVCAVTFASGFSVAKSMPVEIHLISHTVCCLATAYYSAMANPAKELGVYNLSAMRLWCLSHLVALGLTVHTVVCKRREIEV